MDWASADTLTHIRGYTDDKHIAPIDEGGIALAAIQGLNLKVEAREAALREELKRRDTENAELKRELEELKQVVHKLAMAKD